ncbi:MAG: coproporphyrinogen III oxidase [Alphaproteobacteria bacterium]|nr:coproporphyrinogen III oxidase [Alphaproteobacteria bacterium]
MTRPSAKWSRPISTPSPTGPAPLRSSSPPASEGAGFGVYVHWPFCAAKCPYCDFNSHVRRSIDEAAYVAALIRELTTFRDRTGPRTVDSVFFGGGTPSLMSGAAVAGLLEAVDRLWGLPDGVEITLEANPTSVEADRFAAYRAAGVNRLSLGVQALDDASLRALGRLHTAAEARSAIELARARFPRLSFDLIYARPGQSLADWERELGQALALCADHLSLYQLTIEDGTPFADLAARGRLRLPDEELAADAFALTRERTAAAGLPAYEVSNHAVPGAECRHNLVYWRCGDYVGAGPGAHGRLTQGPARHATVTARAPEDWRARVEHAGHGLIEDAALSPEAIGQEFLLMGLRLSEGICRARARALGIDPPADELAELLALGLIELTGERLRVTDAGRPVLNAILARLAGA